MTAEALKKLTDEDLTSWIVAAQGELGSRRETRKRDAMEKIRELAATAEIKVSFGGHARRGVRIKQAAKSTERYQNPENPAEFYVPGHGRSPKWFERLRSQGRLSDALAKI